ncbi:hypothetical protein [Saccharothrix sp. Mg75]|uniref:hypothetical protein n=1 Tax=Saccharothrix sp. Mg75 TaxID=3445357 RepID=UPI003EEC7A61
MIGRRASLLRLKSARIGDAVLVRPVGRLDLSTYAHLRDGLLKHAADQPAALLVVLDEDFEIGSDPLATVFATTWMRVARWPAVPFVLVARERVHREVLTRTGVARFVPYHEGLDRALAAVRQLPLRHRDEIQLPAAPLARVLARSFVRERCGAWHLPRLTTSAVALADELVANALLHTDSAPVLRIDLFPRRLTVAVHDTSPVLPPAPGPGAGARGLAVVEALSTAWGSNHTLDGGKVVWASLAVPPR